MVEMVGSNQLNGGEYPHCITTGYNKFLSLLSCFVFVSSYFLNGEYFINEKKEKGNIESRKTKDFYV